MAGFARGTALLTGGLSAGSSDRVLARIGLLQIRVCLPLSVDFDLGSGRLRREFLGAWQGEELLHRRLIGLEFEHIVGFDPSSLVADGVACLRFHAGAWGRPWAFLIASGQWPCLCLR